MYTVGYVVKKSIVKQEDTIFRLRNGGAMFLDEYKIIYREEKIRSIQRGREGKEGKRERESSESRGV